MNHNHIDADLTALSGVLTDWLSTINTLGSAAWPLLLHLHIERLVEPPPSAIQPLAIIVVTDDVPITRGNSRH